LALEPLQPFSGFIFTTANLFLVRFSLVQRSGVFKEAGDQQHVIVPVHGQEVIGFGRVVDNELHHALL